MYSEIYVVCYFQIESIPLVQHKIKDQKDLKAIEAACENERTETNKQVIPSHKVDGSYISNPEERLHEDTLACADDESLECNNIRLLFGPDLYYKLKGITLLRPSVLWSQTYKYVKLRVMLPDIKEHVTFLDNIVDSTGQNIVFV